MDRIKESPSLIRLIPKRKQGLKKLLFSRVGFFILLIFIQVGLVLGISEYATRFPIFALFMTVFLIVMFVYLFNTNMDSSAKLTWCGLFMFFPVPTALLLLFTQLDVGHRKEKKRLSELVGESKKLVMQDPMTLIKQEIIDSGTADLSFYLNRSGRFPIFENTQVKFFPLGEDKFSAMIP